jgi:MFS family permease
MWSFTIGGVYISETTHKTMRNMFGAFQTISLTLGFVLAYVTCHFVDWRTASKILSVVPLVASVAMLLLPETPYWLVENGKIEEARCVWTS